jgi:NAD+ synthase (glutamine-hydrolysing)
MEETRDYPKLAEFGYARVAAVTPELQLGKPDANAEVIVSLIDKLGEEGVELAVFPELCLTGYTCGDLFHLSGFQFAALAALDTIIQSTQFKATAVVVGLPWLIDGRLYNMAAVVCNGVLCGLVPKSHLPNSGEFYDRRWFSPADTLRRKDVIFHERSVPVGTDLIFHLRHRREFTFGIEICEDSRRATRSSASPATAGTWSPSNPGAVSAATSTLPLALESRRRTSSSAGTP